MKVWVDAQLPPAIARWLHDRFGVDAQSVREVGLHRAKDREIFLAARRSASVVMSKDRDFVRLLEQLGAPPQIVWITCGNTSSARLHEILAHAWPAAEDLLKRGEPLVEISGKGRR